jgi:hypothetical protein
VALVAALDNPDSTGQAVGRAGEAGIPSAIANIGVNGAEVLAFPAGQSDAGYASLGLAQGPSRPCLPREAASATISKPHVGAVAAAMAVEAAVALVSRRLGAARDDRVVFTDDGMHVTSAALTGQPPKSDRTALVGNHIRRCPLSTAHSWAAVAGALGDPAAVLHPDTLPPVTAAAPESSVPLSELGIELWPVLNCTINGAPTSVELTGDARGLGVVRLLEARP